MPPEKFSGENKCVKHTDKIVKKRLSTQNITESTEMGDINNN